MYPPLTESSRNNDSLLSGSDNDSLIGKRKSCEKTNSSDGENECPEESTTKFPRLSIASRQDISSQPESFSQVHLRPQSPVSSLTLTQNDVAETSQDRLSCEATQGSQRSSSWAKMPLPFSQTSRGSSMRTTLPYFIRESTLTDVGSIRPSIGPIVPESVERISLAINQAVQNLMPSDILEKIADHMPAFISRYNRELATVIPNFRNDAVRTLHDSAIDLVSNELEKLEDFLLEKDRLTSSQIVTDYLRAAVPESIAAVHCSYLPGYVAKQKRNLQRELEDLDRDEATKRHEVQEKTLKLNQLMKETTELVKALEEAGQVSCSSSLLKVADSSEKKAIPSVMKLVVELP